ncbi:MAG: hypothetical protein DRQ46_07920 [Gammaproteobacteria bacterium]|nr:MAG: hypothetical protein DRQ46_07920 [Gammaproteobacteria bacterium]
MKKKYSIDAATGLGYLVSQLTHIESKMYEVKYKNITYPNIIPVSNEAGEWAESVTYFFMDGRGVAKFVGSKSLDVPIAEVGTDKVVVPVELAATGYEYSDEELRQAVHLGKPLTQMKANAARRAYEELAQSTSMTGDTAHNLPGFINNTNVTAATVVNPGSGTAWVNKTPAQILFDINDTLADVFVDSLQVERADTLLLPTAQWSYIASTPRSDNSDMTILQYIVANSPYLNSESDVIPVSELAGAGAGATDRMMAYTKDVEKVVFHIPMPLRFTEPQRKGRGFEVPGEFKLSGVEFRYPGSARYADGI